MGNEVLKLTPEKAIDKSVEKFQISGCNLKFEREKSFALQQVMKSDYCYGIAKSNVRSLLNAMANVANIGLSLNPANSHAYLVPRDGAIHLDVSYMGFLKLATDSGVIKVAKAEIVRKNDKFIYRGMFEKPVHEIENAFGGAEERGEIVGVYCEALTNDGIWITDFMDMDQINKVKLSSKAFTSGKSCPWIDFEEEMMKKSMLKRARKTWPQSDGMEKLEEAIHVVNEHEGLQDELPSENQYKQIADYADKYGKTENQMAQVANKSKHSELTSSDARKIIGYINQVKSLESSVVMIKDAIARGDIGALFEVVSELDDSEYSAITKAPTKGGPLTVEERNYLSSDEYKQAVNQMLDEQADEELDNQTLREMA